MTDCQLSRRTRRALYKITKFISSPSLRCCCSLSQISFANFLARGLRYSLRCTNLYLWFRTSLFAIDARDNDFTLIKETQNDKRIKMYAGLLTQLREELG